MTDGGQRTDKRRKKRVRRRIPCELVTSDRRFTGIVLDVSIDGLFVQTSVVLAAGTEVRVRVQRTPSTPGFELDARVARAKRVPPQLVSSAAGGMGLRVLRAPPEFASLQTAGGEEEGERPPPMRPQVAPPPEPAGLPFKVRLKQTAGNRSRTLVVVAADAAAARKKALSDVGAGWDVLEVEAAAS